MSMNLVVDNLGKQYKSGAWGLREFSLTIDPGILAVVGPLGAGKTTLMRMLATVLSPTEGTMAWQGQDVSARPGVLRRVLGYLPQDFGLYGDLSGRAFLLYIAALKGLGRKASRVRVAQVVEKVGLSVVIGQKMETYSNDMRRRVGLAQALLNEPQLLLVDEPGATLDPQERARFVDLLGTLADHRLVILATDSIGDVASIASTLVLLQGGRLVLHTVPGEWVRSMSERVWSVTVDQDTWVEMRRQYLISHLERQGGQVRLRIVSAAKPHRDAVPVEPTLEDAYASSVRSFTAGTWRL
jgi:ABC-2 type transport system ATP-binding protein